MGQFYISGTDDFLLLLPNLRFIRSCVGGETYNCELQMFSLKNYDRGSLGDQMEG